MIQTELFYEHDDRISTKVRNHSYKQVQNSGMADIQRERVKQLILRHPEGITDTEICIHLRMAKSSVTARRNEIKEVCAIGIAKIVDIDGYEDRFNTLWGFL